MEKMKRYKSQLKEEKYIVKHLNKDEDNYVKMSDNIYMQPEDVVSYEKGNLIDTIEDSLIKTVKEHNQSKFSSLIGYYDKVLKFLNIKYDLYNFANKIAKGKFGTFKNPFTLGK
jgi:thiamine pyrophosphokinase